MRDVNENTILIATNNPGKAREYKELFGAYGLEVKTLKDFTEIPAIVEDGKTFTENARKKAQTLSDALGVAALADDSGLVVDALNGEPGIYSARYAGDHDDAANNRKLLANLKGLPTEKRTAHFHCSIVVTRPGKEELVASGDANGLILEEAKGAGGFGYDPLFYYPPLKKTFAELSQSEKNEVSHRGIATRTLMKKFANWWEE